MEGSYLPGFMDQGKYFRRKNPAGSYTHDIFDLEERQKKKEIVVYKDKNNENATNLDKSSMKYYETEDIVTRRDNSGRKLRRSLSDCKIKSDEPTLRTPPLATGKENIGRHFKNSPSSPWSTTIDGITPKKLDESENMGTCQPVSSRYRNPITGEGFGVDGESRNTLEDATNILNKDMGEDIIKKTPRRPCIRVMEPPGGKSSIIF